jgi:ABC-2 type transporter
LTVIGELPLLSFTLTAFGVMMAARITRLQAFMALTQMLVMPLFFLPGALYPLRSLPAWLTVLTRFDPTAYVVYPTRPADLDHLSISPAASAALSRRSRGTGGRSRLRDIMSHGQAKRHYVSCTRHRDIVSHGNEQNGS